MAGPWTRDETAARRAPGAREPLEAYVILRQNRRAAGAVVARETDGDTLTQSPGRRRQRDFRESGRGRGGPRPRLAGGRGWRVPVHRRAERQRQVDLAPRAGRPARAERGRG